MCVTLTGGPSLSQLAGYGSTETMQALQALHSDAAAAAAPAAPPAAAAASSAPAGVHRRGFPYSPSGLQLNTSHPPSGAGAAGGDPGCMAV